MLKHTLNGNSFKSNNELANLVDYNLLCKNAGYNLKMKMYIHITFFHFE